MTLSSWNTISGENEITLNGTTGRTLNAVLIYVTSITNPRIRVLGASEPKQLQYAGSWCSVTNGVNPSSVTQDFATPMNPIQFDRQVWSLTDTQLVTIKIKYRLPPGATYQIQWSF